MTGVCRQPHIFLIVVLHIAIFAECRDIFILLYRLVGHEVVGADAIVHSLLLPDAYPDRAEALLRKKLGGVEIRRLDELSAGGIQVAKIPTDDSSVTCQVLDHRAHRFKPRLNAFALVILADTIGRGCNGHLCFVAIHEFSKVNPRSGIAAHESMHPQLPDVSGLGDRAFRLDFFGFSVNVEIILHRFLGVESIQKLIDFCGIETGERDIEFAAVKFREQSGQLILVPFALNLIERNIQCLLSHRVEIHYDAVNLCDSKITHDRQPLMSADHIAGLLIPDDRFNIPKLRNAALELFVFCVTGFKRPTRVVFRSFQLCHGNFIYLHISSYPSSRSIKSSFGLLPPMGVSQLSFTIW